MQAAIAIFPFVLLPFDLSRFVPSCFLPCPQRQINRLALCPLASFGFLVSSLCHHSSISSSLLPGLSRQTDSCSFSSLFFVYSSRGFTYTETCSSGSDKSLRLFLMSRRRRESVDSFYYAPRSFYCALHRGDFANVYLCDLHVCNHADCIHGKPVNDRCERINTFMDCCQDISQYTVQK